MKSHLRAYVKPVTSLKKKDYLSLIRAAIAEDKTHFDVTTNAIFEKKQIVSARLVTRQPGILCGKEIFTEVFSILDTGVKVEFFFNDGDKIKKGDQVAALQGDVKSMFQGERIALNFISMLSGISTLTKKAVDILKPLNIIPLDTRKTLPGFRMLSKYAVFMGGGSNHRANLQQMGLIKDNHIAAAGSIQKAVALFREKYPLHKCEVEVETATQLSEALKARPEMILLDNMSAPNIKRSVDAIARFNRKNNTAITAEASGGYNLENISTLAGTGVDFVSMGCLTNHITPLDFSLEVNQA